MARDVIKTLLRALWRPPLLWPFLSVDSRETCGETSPPRASPGVLVHRKDSTLAPRGPQSQDRTTRRVMGLQPECDSLASSGRIQTHTTNKRLVNWLKGKNHI